MNHLSLLNACGIDERDAWKAASAGLATEYAAWPWFQSNPMPLTEKLNPTWYTQTSLVDQLRPSSPERAARPDQQDVCSGPSISVLAEAPEGTRDEPKDSAPSGRSRRFGVHATSTLKQWMNSHAAYPYPSEKEEDDLITDTGLSLKQIRTYLSNARARTRRRHGMGMSCGHRGSILS